MTDVIYGQWKGVSEKGTYLIVNIDRHSHGIKGQVSTHFTLEIDGTPRSFWTWAELLGEFNPDNSVTGFVGPAYIYDGAGERLDPEDLDYLKNTFQLEGSTQSTFNANLNGLYKLNVTWTSNYPTLPTEADSVTFEKERLGGSKIKSTDLSWNQFKEHALSQADGLIYRGQARNWRLQTTFHRTGYSDLVSYLDQKIPELENHINSVSKHLYHSKDDRSLGALLNLAQHHGYPTPLLDWTRSPYVAAFFAFENTSKIKIDGKITIFSFDDEAYAQKAGRLAKLRVPNIVIRTLELPTFGNQRVLPQQAITMYSNVDDIEGIIQANEAQPGQLLKSISIPSSERDVAMKDLSRMGITWGSMFPGLDGICKQMATRHFYKR